MWIGLKGWGFPLLFSMNGREGNGGEEDILGRGVGVRGEETENEEEKEEERGGACWV